MLSQEPMEAGPSRPIQRNEETESGETALGLGGGEDEREREQQAAVMIQKHYRGHQARQKVQL
jgi:hypothetical protein